MRRSFLVFLVLITCAFPAVAQAKHPFTFEDMMKLKRVGEPEVSPDGKWVIFSVVDVDLEANTKTPHIWIVPTAGGQEREIIADQDGDRPRWAPDGKRFAFLSTKEGGSQVWVAEFDGAAGTVTRAWKLTSMPTEAGGELWSQDGKNILFTSDVYPECDGAPLGEVACNAEKLDEASKSKVKALIFDRLLYRHWNAYREGKRSHIFVTNAPPVASERPSSGTEATSAYVLIPPRDLTPGDYDAPVFSLGEQDDYAFSPDGQEICYTSNHDKNEAASTNNDLWIVPINFPGDAKPADVLAKRKNITADNPASDSTPLYSPDGRYIAYRAQQRPGYESDRFRLMLYDRKTGEKKSLTENSDLWVGTLAWATNSRAIFQVAEHQGTAAIDRIAVESDMAAAERPDLGSDPPDPLHIVKIPPTPFTFATGVLGVAHGAPPLLSTISPDLGYDDDLAPTPDGERILFTRMSIHAPIEIYSRSTGPEGTWPRVGKQLTHFNDAVLSQVAMSPLESFWFTGAHGDKVQGFLVKPPNFDASKKYPVKFLIHGGPQGAWGDDWSYRWNAELFAANGYVVIMINFHGSTGYGQKFIDAINGEWGGAPYEDLMKGLDYAEEHYAFIDKTRECALGASFGGYMANWILGHTDRFKCIVSHDGIFNVESQWGTTEELWFNDWEFKGTPYTNRELYRKWSPHLFATNFKTPTLVIHGQRDYRLDVSEGLQLFTTLQMEGVPSKMLYFPDEGHWVLKPQNARLWYKTVNDWVDQWINDQGTKK
jgi:dipeptidyl aminopeptidase/acylaminoacyl peptidase